MAAASRPNHAGKDSRAAVYRRDAHPAGCEEEAKAATRREE